MELQTCFTELVHELSVFRLLEKVVNAFGNARSDFVDFLEFFDAGLHHRVERAKVLRQEFSGALAHEADAQAVDNALQREFARRLNFVENVLGGLVAHALKFQQVQLGEAVNVGDILHQPAFRELIDQRIAHAFDVHDRTGSKVENAFAKLGGAIYIDAAMIGFALDAHDFSAADRAMLGHVELAVPARVVFVVNDLHHFRNDVTTPLNHHPVTDLDAEALDLILVVKSGAADGGAADGHRLQKSHRSQFAGASHLDVDVLDLRHTGSSRVLVGDGPARRFAGIAEFVLQTNVIDLDDDAVNFVIELVTLGLPLVDEIPDVINVVDELPGTVDLETRFLQGFQGFAVFLEMCAAIDQ